LIERLLDLLDAALKHDSDASRHHHEAPWNKNLDVARCFTGSYCYHGVKHLRRTRCYLDWIDMSKIAKQLSVNE
jgi:hypothetical protein